MLTPKRSARRHELAGPGSRSLVSRCGTLWRATPRRVANSPCDQPCSARNWRMPLLRPCLRHRLPPALPYR